MFASINNKNCNCKPGKSFITQNHLLFFWKKNHREKVCNTGKTNTGNFISAGMWPPCPTLPGGTYIGLGGREVPALDWGGVPTMAGVYLLWRGGVTYLGQEVSTQGRYPLPISWKVGTPPPTCGLIHKLKILPSPYPSDAGGNNDNLLLLTYKRDLVWDQQNKNACQHCVASYRIL